MQADELKDMVKEYAEIQSKKVAKVRQAVKDHAATRQEQTAQHAPYPTPSP